ncbi:MAG: helix-turn-helix transcriptional regulator [Nostocaceae cyanobacterium]|nr:helix-turn-helix transcriptional regulator [Nostocaceae cyanobacterium]
MTVKIILKETRQKKEISREQLAVKSGISISYIQKLEQNVAQRVSLEIYDKLCKALNCYISDILIYTEDEAA